MTRVILPRSHHCISRRNIDPNAIKVLYRLHHQGFKAYLVGGSVRDLLLGRKPKDFDIATNARPHQVRRLFKNCFLIGKRFRLAHVKFGDQIVEVSTFRRSTNEVEDDGSVKLVTRDNCYGTPREDALRRDFTINGIFYNIADFSVIDYVNGLEDLKTRIVRTIGDPEVRFQEDPVRMIRAIRVAARLGFTIEEQTLAAITKYRAATLRCSEVRTFEEILTLMRYGAACNSLMIFESVGLAEILLPELHEFLLMLEAKSLDPVQYYWRFLQALDALQCPCSDLTLPVLVGAFFLPIIRYFIEIPEVASAAIEGELPDLIQERIEPFIKRLHFPTRHRDRLVQILACQRKFWAIGKQRFKSGPVMKRSYFREGLLLFKLSVLALNKGSQQLKLWEDRVQEIQQKQQSSPPEEPKPTSRRRKRRPKKQPTPLLETPTVEPSTVVPSDGLSD